MSRLLRPALFLGVCNGNAWNKTATCSLHNRHFSNEPKWNNFGASDIRFPEDQVPKQSDILIVGGGLIGWSVAFWMRWTTKFGVTVVERDPTYARSASVLGLGSIRQQFSEPENIQMSLFSSDFLRNIKDYLSVLDDSQLDIEFNPQGCLLLADNKQAGTMEQNFHLQTELGAKVELLSKGALKSRWPWLNVEDIELGCYGYENEGWFDPWLLLKALRAKCHTLGVNYVVGEVVDFEASQYLTEISFPDMPKRAPVIGRALREAVWSEFSVRSIALWTLISLRHVYVVRPKRAVLSPQGRRPPEPTVEPEPLQSPGLDTPFIVDPKRLFVERRGLSGEFIVYSDDPQWDSVLVTAPQQICNFNADYTLFKESLGQQLAHRIPTLASVDVTSAWAAVCDYNTVDQNLIIGHHPYHVNMFFCNGSSGHGSQHSIAIGRAISELIVYGHYKTIDLTRFSFDRFYLNESIQETNAF
ncbi:hypothetical protein P879_08998 [Paragonimus westermani]|uniref:FAD-dependent oxidoreductase domain-containing protein 1 n=1 Tax=Paragonimus westermani TaxID=34504 RepID=A0A8T0DGD8_9TREM|nr:hypothetical protein P879_08998 [Paragonimus westermani]